MLAYYYYSHPQYDFSSKECLCRLDYYIGPHKKIELHYHLREEIIKMHFSAIMIFYTLRNSCMLLRGIAPQLKI